jgi:hypothetical protein
LNTHFKSEICVSKITTVQSILILQNTSFAAITKIWLIIAHISVCILWLAVKQIAN